MSGDPIALLPGSDDAQINPEITNSGRRPESDDDDEEDIGMGDIFPDPPRSPSPEPTIEVYQRDQGLYEKALQLDVTGVSWITISIRLVGSHPLWGHHLWNAARCFATYLDSNSTALCKGKTILELGAGGGLPGLVAAKIGAKRVVLTDYPDYDLVRNMEINVEENIRPDDSSVSVQGYIWGTDPTRLLRALTSEEHLDAEDHTSTNVSFSSALNQTTYIDPEAPRYDLILMSDLVFNHSQHDALLKTCEQTLSLDVPSSRGSVSETPCVLVFYTHHRPHLAHRDLEFFSKARARGWDCEEFLTEKMQAMFPEDSGDVDVRATVHGWKMYRELAGI